MLALGDTIKFGCNNQFRFLILLNQKAYIQRIIQGSVSSLEHFGVLDLQQIVRYLDINIQM